VKRIGDLTGPEVLVIVGGSLAAIGALLPWASITTGLGTFSVAGMDAPNSDAVLILILGVATAVPSSWVPWHPWQGGVPNVIAGALLIGLALFGAISLRPLSATATLSIGSGLWIVGIGGVLAMLGGLGEWKFGRDATYPSS